MGGVAGPGARMLTFYLASYTLYIRYIFGILFGIHSDILSGKSSKQEEEEEETRDGKSNDPHLTGGEKLMKARSILQPLRLEHAFVDHAAAIHAAAIPARDAAHHHTGGPASIGLAWAATSISTSPMLRPNSLHIFF